MRQSRIVLGLDIGVSSIGWGLVQLEEEPYPYERDDGTVEQKQRIVNGRIIGTGVRCFQVPQDREKKSLAKKRGIARRNRWRVRRRAQRLKRLVELGKEFGLIGEDFRHEKYLKPGKGDGEGNWDIWTIRKEGLERKLSDVELFRVLYHIAKHRGFYFHTKAEELQEEDAKSKQGQVKRGLASVEKKLRGGGWETVGQMFYATLKQAEGKRKRNRKDSYENLIHRRLLEKEIVTVFERQRKFLNGKAGEELQKRYIEEILLSEKGPDEAKLQKMMGVCDFTGKRCAPKAGYTAERFMLFNRLNSMSVGNGERCGGGERLTDQQRRTIEELAYNNEKVTFWQVRNALGLDSKLDARFNLCSYREHDPEYRKKLECAVKGGKLEFDEKHRVPVVNIRTGEVHELDGEIREVFESKKLWPNAKKIHVFYSDIRKQLSLSEDVRFLKLSGYTKSAEELGSEAKYVKQFENAIFVELRGYHKLRKAIEGQCGQAAWQELRQDTDRLDAIAEALTYCKSDVTRRAYLKERGIQDEKVIEAILRVNMSQVANHSQEAMRRLLQHMENGALFNEAKEECGYGRVEYDKQRLLQPYSGVFENNPVVARVISQARKVVNAIVRKYGEEYPIDQIHVEVATDLASSKKRREEIAWGQQRYREEKERAKERCREFGIDPDEGQNLLKFRLAEEQNCRCVYSGARITLYPGGGKDEVYVLDCEIDHIIPMSRSFNDSLNNKVVCTPQANQNKRDRIPYEWFEERYGKDSEQWSAFERTVKQLYGMPYPKRRNLLRRTWTEEDKERFISRDLNDTRYAARHLAEYMRKYFDFSRSKRSDIKEVKRIQVRSGGVTAFLRHMWGLNKDREANHLHHAVDALVVACATDGHVYLVSNLSKEVERKGENWYRAFGRDKFKPWGLVREDIMEAVGRIFVSRMPRRTVTSAAHEESIKSMKKERPKKRVVEVGGGYAEIGDIVRADVFVDEKGHNYMVPIYAVDMACSKPLPDKYLHKNDAPYAEWPSAKDDGLTFRFSLYKDELVSLDGKMYYVAYVRGRRAVIAVKNVDGSPFPNGRTEVEMAYRRAKLAKYCVDVLGSLREVHERRRVGNQFEESKRGRKGQKNEGLG